MSEMKIVECNLLDMDNAAKLLSIKKSTLYQLVMRKAIAHKKIGRLNRFSMQDIQEYINKNHVGIQ